MGWAVGFKFAFKADHLATGLTIAAMWGSFALLAYAVRALPIGTAYAVWTGIGATGAALIGIIWLKEPATAVRIGSICLVVIGVIGLKLGAKPV